MHKLASSILLASIFALGFQSAPARAESMSSTAMMPSCPASDPAVGVNMTTKMYMTAAQMKAKSAGMTMAQKQAMMKKNNVKMMCKSKADAMGAKMMKPSSM